nr:hypothetical protein [uncultured Methanolobus sp.]
MKRKKITLVLLSLLLVFSLVSVASADEQKTKITYISYKSNTLLEEASHTNAYSDLIDYTFINYYDYGVGGTSPDIINAAESGFFDTQDVILCVGAMPALYGNTTVTDAFKAAHNSGTELYGIYGNEPPECFDYYSVGNTSRTIDRYYTNMVNSSLEESVRLENAEDLLVYLTMAQKITYISYKPNTLLEEASLTNAYGDLIDYTFINYYDYGVGGTSPDIINAAESGFFDTQDVILCVGAMPALYGNTTVTDGFKAAHNSGTELYSIYGNEPPECFDYYSAGNTSRTIDQYYTNMVNSSLEESLRLENAEDLLVYLTMAQKITYISYKPNTLLEEASLTNAYSDLIDYTFINYYRVL